MDNETIKLFNHDQNTVIMPQIKQETDDENQQSLVSEDISSDISGESVKIIRVKEDTIIDENNFILDLSDVGQITASQKEVIKSLISSYGNTSIYLYKKQGLIKLGEGDKYSLERILPLIKLHVFDNAIRIYKNFKRDEPVNEISTKDITKLRLHL